MTALRWTLGTAGALLLGIGGWLLVTETREDTVPQVLLWLVGAVAVHDGLLVPLVLLIGAALRRPFGSEYGKGGGDGSGVSNGNGYGVLRGGLVVGGCLTLVALPLLLRQGQGRNPSALPLDYATNWQLLLAVTLAVTLVLLPIRVPSYRAGLARPYRSILRRLRGSARHPHRTPRK
ncbi:hypothetical protein AB0I77_23090 [Streptomyces sp. NPDC050619]|uniref:hypothetical protein n=1 Tax=Streptomyces sp. NPDC050619 TaxID=3157214 RepID=UPI003440A9B0